MSVDLLLANPLFLSQNEAERELMSPYFPLGLLYLAASVRDCGYSVAVFDGTFAKDESAAGCQCDGNDNDPPAFANDADIVSKFHT